MIEKAKNTFIIRNMINNDDIKCIFGTAVKNLRQEKGITQEKLAEFLDIERQTVATIETGKRFVSSELLSKLCNFFNVEPYVFFVKQGKTYTKEDLDYIEQITFKA